MIDHHGGAPAPAPRTTPPGSVVALVDATSPTERDLIGTWLADGGLTTEFGAEAPITQLIWTRAPSPTVSPAGVTIRSSSRSECCGCRPNAMVSAG